MKYSNIFLTLALSLSFVTFGQKEREKIEFRNDTIQVFEKIDMNGKYRPGLLLLDFFRKERRFAYGDLIRLTQKQLFTNSSSPGDNQRRPGGSIPMLYINGEQLLGNGMNRLYLINNIRLKDVKWIARSSKFDMKLYVQLMDGVELN